MKRENLLRTIILGLMLILPTVVLAASQITIDTIIEKQVITVSNGTKEIRFAPTESAVPGDVLRVTLSYSNVGDATANDAVIDNPIPPNTSHLADTATSIGVEELLFSIDNGVNFNKPELLTREIKKADGSIETKIASPDEYTHIRWQLPPLPAGAAGRVSFNVLVK